MCYKHDRNTANNGKFEMKTPTLKNFCERLLLYKTLSTTEKLCSNFTLVTERDILFNQFQISIEVSYFGSFLHQRNKVVDFEKRLQISLIHVIAICKICNICKI